LAKVKQAVFKAAMSGLYHSGATRLLSPYTQGSGLIFMLHQVRPAQGSEFNPNGILEITPEFFEAVLDQVAEAGLDIVPLDEAVTRLKEGDDRRFACLTFDDGYRDNFEYAYPILKRRNLPATVYIPTDYPPGRGELWWLALQEVIARADEIELCRDGSLWRLPTATVQEKWRAFEQIYGWLRAIDQVTQRQVVRALSERYGVDMEAMCRDLIMDWDELREIAADPLITIGAHTKGHYALAKLSSERAREEMKGGADCLAEKLGRWPEHFAYPYGDETSAGPREFHIAKELGFKTAVTTRKGMLFPAHKDHLTALPRVSLNGDYQSLTYTGLYLSGAPFALYNRFREVNAA